MREDVASFPFPHEMGGVDAVLDAYDLARPRLNVMLSLLGARSGQRGADISTGLGFLPLLFRRTGVTLLATERDRDVSIYAISRGVEVLAWDIGRSPAPMDAASLDFVIFAEVLEHLKLAPIPALSEVTRLLRPHGTLLLTTPNIARREHIEALLEGENFLEPFSDGLPLDRDATDYVDHVREYSIRETVDTVEGAGLEIESVVMTGWGENGYTLHANPFLNEICVVLAHTDDSPPQPRNTL